MTEPKRAIWSDFIEWMVEFRPDYCKGAIVYLSDAAPFVDSERAARAVLVARGCRPEWFDPLRVDWLHHLRARGVDAPVDVPSSAQVLEDAAVAIERDTKRLLDAAVREANARKSLRDDTARRASSVYESDLRARASAFTDCAVKLRGRARMGP